MKRTLLEQHFLPPSYSPTRSHAVNSLFQLSLFVILLPLFVFYFEGTFLKWGIGEQGRAKHRRSNRRELGSPGNQVKNGALETGLRVSLDELPLPIVLLVASLLGSLEVRGCMPGRMRGGKEKGERGVRVCSLEGEGALSLFLTSLMSLKQKWAKELDYIHQ